MVYHVQFPGLGLDLTVNRVALAIGGFNIYWYGVIIAAGMLLAMLYAFRNAVDYGIDSDRLVDVVAIGTVMAIVCARIYYVAMAPFEYQSLWEMIDIRKGGIAIYGAVIGAFVFGGLAAKWRKVPLLPLFDREVEGFGEVFRMLSFEEIGTSTLQSRAVAGVANRTLSKAQAFAEQYGIEKVYETVEDLYEDPDIDAVYITTPHNTHITYLRAALAAGMHPIQIPDLLVPDDSVRALGHMILPSLDAARGLLERRLAGEPVKS